MPILRFDLLNEWHSLRGTFRRRVDAPPIWLVLLIGCLLLGHAVSANDDRWWSTSAQSFESQWGDESGWTPRTQTDPARSGDSAARIGSLGNSLSTGGSTALPQAADASSAEYWSDGRSLQATPTLYPWYEFSESSTPPYESAPPPVVTDPSGVVWEPAYRGPRISSIRGEFTVLIPDHKGFGLTALDLSMPIELRPDSGLYVTPRFNWHFFSDPLKLDIPNDLYAASLRWEAWFPYGEAWLFQMFVEPMLATDFNTYRSDAWRIPGQGMVFYRWSPAYQLAAGVVYLDRDDIQLLPAGGIIYQPHERVRYEFVFPRPKLAWQYGFDRGVEKWFYVLGEFGGGSWAVRQNGIDDVMTYRDFRILGGLEQKRPGDFSWQFEFGLALGREVEFRSGMGDFTTSPTLLGRVGLKY